jgi:hypothetical protein
MDENKELLEQLKALEGLALKVPTMSLDEVMALGDKVAMFGMLVSMGVACGGAEGKRQLGPIQKGLKGVLATISHRALDLGKEAGHLTLTDYGFLKAKLEDAIAEDAKDAKDDLDVA